MLLYKRLFIIILCILNSSMYTSLLAQDRPLSLNDLPKCAIPCANEAALAAGCQPSNTNCVCAHKIPPAALQCSSSPNQCSPLLINFAESILNEMCIGDTDPTTDTDPITPTRSISPISILSLNSPSSSRPNQIQLTPIPIIPTSTSQTSSTSTTTSTTSESSTTPDVFSFSFQSTTPTTTQLASSTVFLIKTVTLHPTPQPTSLSVTGGAGRLDISFITRALCFCLPSLISLFAAI